MGQSFAIRGLLHYSGYHFRVFLRLPFVKLVVQPDELRFEAWTTHSPYARVPIVIPRECLITLEKPYGVAFPGLHIAQKLERFPARFYFWTLSFQKLAQGLQCQGYRITE
jgi:hypothetical protein